MTSLQLRRQSSLNRRVQLPMSSVSSDCLYQLWSINSSLKLLPFDTERIAVKSCRTYQNLHLVVMYPRRFGDESSQSGPALKAPVAAWRAESVYIHCL